MHKAFIVIILIEIILALVSAGILLAQGYGIVLAVAAILIWLGVLAFTAKISLPQS